MVTFLTVSISSGLLSAIKSVKANKVASSIIMQPKSSYNKPFLSRKYKKQLAPIRLLPSKKL